MGSTGKEVEGQGIVVEDGNEMGRTGKRWRAQGKRWGEQGERWGRRGIWGG